MSDRDPTTATKPPADDRGNTPRTSAATHSLPVARVQPRTRRWSWTWLVPIAAVALALVLILQAQSERGRTINIRFDDAGGIQPNDPLLYRGVHAGRVRSITLAPDLNSVVVSAELVRDATNLAVDGSKFWVVRPVVSLTRVSGLETLVGPRYLEVEPGPPSSVLRTDFKGLERAPSGVEGTPKRRGENAGKLAVVVEASHRGSVAVGSPVFFRDVKVGVVNAFELSDDFRTVDIALSIEPEYAALVRTNTEFWNAGGIGVDFGFSTGLSVKAGSIESVLGGGIAFATPTKAGTRAQPGQRFVLHPEPKKEWADWSPDLSDEPRP